MKNFLLILFFSLIFSAGFSQSTNICDSTSMAKEGTYEIIRLSKEEEVFTKDILCLIEKSRHQFEIVNLQISSYTTIRIYPKQKTQNNKSSK